MKSFIYIAAPYQMREVTSRWLTEDSAVENDEWARKDLDDVASADLLLALNPDAWKQLGSGGRHVEFGYAVALGKKIVVLGVRSNIFHHLSDVRVISSLEDL